VPAFVKTSAGERGELYLWVVVLEGFIKEKKDSKNISSSFVGMSAPTFTMPRLIEKKKPV